MAYLLELIQDDHRCVVGVFASEVDVLRMVDRLPGRHEDSDHPGVYWLEPAEVPELTEIEHDGWVFPLCRAAFSLYPADGVIDVVWNEVQVFDEAEEYFRARGRVATRHALGSQDGEYVAVGPADRDEPDSLVFLLDPAAVLIRERSRDFEDFLTRYLDELR